MSSSRWLPDVNSPFVHTYLSLAQICKLFSLSKQWNSASLAYLTFTLRYLRTRSPIQVKLRDVLYELDEYIREIQEEDRDGSWDKVHLFSPICHIRQGNINHVTIYATPPAAPAFRHCTVKRNGLADFDVQMGLAASEEFVMRYARPKLPTTDSEASFHMYNTDWTMTRMYQIASGLYNDSDDDMEEYLDENSDLNPRVEYFIHARQVQLDDFDFAALLPKQIWRFYFHRLYGGTNDQWEPFDKLLKPLELDHQWLAFHSSRHRIFYNCWCSQPVQLFSALQKGCIPFTSFMTAQADMSYYDRETKYKAFEEFVNSTLRSIWLASSDSVRILADFTSQFDPWTREIAAKKEQQARALEEAQARDARRIALVRALQAKKLNLRGDSKVCSLYISQASAMWLGKPLTLERVVQIMLDAHVLFTFTKYREFVAAGFANRSNARYARRRDYSDEFDGDDDDYDSDDLDEDIYTDEEIRHEAKLKALRACKKTSHGAELAADLLRRILAGEA